MAAVNNSLKKRTASIWIGYQIHVDSASSPSESFHEICVEILDSYLQSSELTCSLQVGIAFPEEIKEVLTSPGAKVHRPGNCCVWQHSAGVPSHSRQDYLFEAFCRFAEALFKVLQLRLFSSFHLASRYRKLI